MGRRLRLFFSTEPVFDSKSGIELHKGIRLLTVAQFLAQRGWTEPEIAIVDTGAPISLIPHRIWRKCVIKIIGEAKLRGVIPKEECVMSVKVATVGLRLIEPEYATEKIEVKAYLAPINEVPLIVGFENLLSEFNVFFSYYSQIAFIEEIK
jgi:hypothetical protein